MRGNGWARRAEEFDSLVSGNSAASDQDLSDLLDVVAMLRAEAPRLPEARPEFVTSLRTQLVAAAERAPATTDDALAARLTPRQRRGSRERRLAAIVGGFAVVSATGSMAVAAQDALPGDVLYPVKRAIENAQTNLQGDRDSTTSTLISHAEGRLDEARELAARDADADTISSALEDFATQARQASDYGLADYARSGNAERISELRAFTADSMDILGALGPVVPADTRPMLITASQTVRQIDVAAWEVCPTCSSGDLAQIPDFATQSLSMVLGAELPPQASVTSPTSSDDTTTAPDAQQPVDPEDLPVLPDDIPDAAQDPTAGPSEPTRTEGPISKTVDDVTGKVTDGIKDGVDKLSPTEGSSNTSLTGTLIDGVGGLLGGLLGGK